MKFELFKELYDEALEIASLELYVAERGWQDWMEGYTPDEVAELLGCIYHLANNPLKDTREVSRAEFSRRYGIPVRTLQDWDLGNRSAPEYVKLLIDFAQFSKVRNDDN
jgi:hypothetical protein